MPPCQVCTPVSKFPPPATCGDKQRESEGALSAMMMGGGLVTTRVGLDGAASRGSTAADGRCRGGVDLDADGFGAVVGAGREDDDVGHEVVGPPASRR